MSPATKRWLNRAGSLLAVAGVGFVAWKLWQHRGEVDFGRFQARHWALFTAVALGYGAAGWFLAMGWRRLLAHFGQRVDRRWAWRVYGVSQIAKYVPGNIFQFAGRQGLGQAAGLPAGPLAKSTLWEIICLFGGAGVFVCLLAPHFIPGLSQRWGEGLFVAAFLCFWWAARRFISKDVGGAALHYFLFLLQSGLGFAAALLLIASSFGLSAGNISYVCGAYVIAWLTGFVTPGAPAGAGVREAVLYALLRGQIDYSDLLAAVLLGRFITVGGDVAYYVAAALTPTTGPRMSDPVEVSDPGGRS